MSTFSRRNFIRGGGLGLAALGVGGTAYLLSEDNAPTPPSGEMGAYGEYLKEKAVPPRKASENFAPTEENIQGPFFREGAPFRAKITPPLEPGTVLLIGGVVWGHDTKKPLANARLDIWQANHDGRYDNDDPRSPPKKDEFKYRARLLTDENGYYEYETIHPGRYKVGRELWRPSHIHYFVHHPGYKSLVTQLYFKGDPCNEKDEFIKPSLIVDLEKRRAGEQGYEAGRFDIVLANA